MIDTLFLDLDDTILDFGKSEDVAVRKALASSGVEVSDAVVSRYSAINKLHWQRLERGELNREQVKVQRFETLFRELGMQADARRCALEYEELLAEGFYFLPGAKEALDILKEHYRLYLVSNGTFSVQHRRLTDSGLYPYFQQVFISEQIGADKPSAAFFDHCFAHMDHPDRSKTLIIGDSMTSDMLGGIRAGLRTCWVNPGHLPRKFEVDYEIESLVQLLDLLKNA